MAGAVKRWGGRESTRLVAYTLATKGTVCHLCASGHPDDPDPVGHGADSADHEPPRVQLLRLGVANPDDPRYLVPAHLRCNLRRKDRPLTPELRVKLREARMTDLGLTATASAVRLSPALAARRPPPPAHQLL